MRIIFLSQIGTILFDVVAWLILHFGIGYRYSKLPLEKFDPGDKKYLPKKWEKDGEIYQKIFKVKSWKNKIPSGAKMYKGSFEIKRLPTKSAEYLTIWIKESCRAEACHWAMILPGFLFFLWNTVEVGWWMVMYAVLNNMVPIIMQRYNRPRMLRLLSRVEGKQIDQNAIDVQFESDHTYSQV